jgi:hypothetical protein
VFTAFEVPGAARHVDHSLYPVVRDGGSSLYKIQSGCSSGSDGAYEHYASYSPLR